MSASSNALTALQEGAVASGRRPEGANARFGKPATLSFARLLLVGLLHTTVTYARPLANFGLISILGEDEGQDEPKDPADARLWIYLSTALVLVLLGGVFAGLTIALMGQDEIYLQVIAESGEGSEKRNAEKVFKLLQRGKHWVLVTLLVSNVITNETLPIVLDRSIGGGYAAAISSTVLVIIFGEIVPQSICVRFGLSIGSWCSTFVLTLMWITAPITWPIAKLLDYLLGEEHGTTYKKAGLKTLVTLHQTMGGAPGERLNEDEVSIISGVLDLKAKPVGSIMTPMNDVFTLPSDAILNEEMMDDIVREGYSRIPIHQPKNRNDFVGMLLVKMLITYDPEDAKSVSEFALATLPETSPATSCLDIINFFQQGKSHMVLVSDFPGQSYGALGVVTLEDVIEELIGEEIIDESDVYVDIHKAIRRMAPAPVHHACSYHQHNDIIVEPSNNEAIADEATVDAEAGELAKQTNENVEPQISGEPHTMPPSKRPSAASLTGHRHTAQRMPTFLMRRKSSGSGSQGPRTVKMNTPEMREAMRKLGPSNLASQPKQPRIGTIKVKPGVGPTIPEHSSVILPDAASTLHDTERRDIISSGFEASDGVQAINTGNVDKGTAASQQEDEPADKDKSSAIEDESSKAVETKTGSQENESRPRDAMKQRSGSHSTLGSLHSASSGSPNTSAGYWRGRKTAERKAKKGTARSGSITESFVDSGGIKKLVLEPTSSGSDDVEGAVAAEPESTQQDSSYGTAAGNPDEAESSAAPKRRRRGKGAKGGKSGADADGADEGTPLLKK